MGKTKALTDYLSLKLKVYCLALSMCCISLCGHGQGYGFLTATVNFNYYENDSLDIFLYIYSEQGEGKPEATQAVSLSSGCGSISVYLDSTESYQEGTYNPCNSSEISLQAHIYSKRITIPNEWAAQKCCNINIGWSQCCLSNKLRYGGAEEPFYTYAAFSRCRGRIMNDNIKSNNVISHCLGTDLIMRPFFVPWNSYDTSHAFFDSASYSLSNPLRGPGLPVNYELGFSAKRPTYFYGYPKTGKDYPRGFHLDSINGNLLFRPTAIGDGLIAVTYRRFRNDILVSEQLSTIYSQIYSCATNAPPVISGINCSKPKASNFMTHACARSKICFTVCTTDRDRGDSVKIGWNRGFPNATFEVINVGERTETGRFCWTPDDSRVSRFPYNFVVDSRDDACPVNGIAARSFQITVHPKVDFTQGLSKDSCGNLTFWAKGQPGSKPRSYEWRIASGSYKLRPDSTDSVGFTIQLKDTGLISYTVLAENRGCNKIDSGRFFLRAPQRSFGLDFKASHTAMTNPPYQTSFSIANPDTALYTYRWEFGDGQVASGIIVSHTYNTAGMFSPKAIATRKRDGCAQFRVKRELISTGYFTSIHYAQEGDRLSQLYPNPAKDQLFFKNIKPGSLLRLYDVNGRLTLEHKFHLAVGSLDISTLPKGVYHASILGSGNSTTHNEQLIVIY